MSNKTYRFLVFQNYKSYYKGYLEIEASSKKKALEILESTPKEAIEGLCFNWTQADDTTEDGDIDVDTASIEEV